MIRSVSLLACLVVLGAQAPAPQVRTQISMSVDPAFDARVDKPAYAKTHPLVLIDAAHGNTHTGDTAYKPFAVLMANDGYRVEANRSPFTSQSLAGAAVLVVVNALRAGDFTVAEPAFTDQECKAVLEWVRGGGSLLLVADHFPFGGAAKPLSAAVGVEMAGGVTRDPLHADREYGNPTFILYTREEGNLAAHAITDGRNASERVNRVEAFTGQSLKGPPGSTALLLLGDRALDTDPPNPQAIKDAIDAAKRAGRPESEGIPLRLSALPHPAAGRAQAIAETLGKGRVVVLGEAAMLTAQLGPDNMKIGFNHAGLDNRQFALNVMHWLSHALN